MALGLVMTSGINAEAEEYVTDADESTFDSWQTYLLDSDGNYTTENIGRIWTDKTVENGDFTFSEGTLNGQTISAGESDFIVALSALSSTVNVRTEEAAQPLDVVLVLDVSSSMREDNKMDQTVSATNRLIDAIMGTSEYSRIGIVAFSETVSELLPLDHYTATGNDGNYINYNGTDRVSTSVEGYTGSVNVANATYTQGGLFYGMKMLADVQNTTVDVNGKMVQRMPVLIALSDGEMTRSCLEDWRDPSEGSTNTAIVNGYAMNRTLRVFSTLMSAAYGKQLAASNYGGTEPTVYTIGVSLEDSSTAVGVYSRSALDPTNYFQLQNGYPAQTTTIQRALCYGSTSSDGIDQRAAVSSAYEAWNDYKEGGNVNVVGTTDYYNGSAISFSHTALSGDNVDLTNLTDDFINYSDQYYDVANAEDLTDIFEEITGNIVNSSAGVPTETTGGFDNSGYITFSDQLGDYMQVDDFKSIVYNNQIYRLDEETGITVNGNVTTYTFEAEVTANNPAEETITNLNNIIIEVTKSDDPKIGDLVEVQIPAALIPLRTFNVETAEDGTSVMTVEENYPIRIFYGASIKESIVTDTKDGEEAAIKNPDEDLREYIAENHTEDSDGNVNVVFYSNKWNGGTDGDTTASFTPAQTNIFYYFAQNTYVYRDEACTEPADRTDIENPNATYYYQRTYYIGERQSDGTIKAKQETKTSTFPGENFSFGSDNYGYDEEGNLFIAPKAHRVSTINNMKTDKEDIGANNTNTATTVINPTWTDTNEGESIRVALGNNGTLSAELPGTLAISKAVTATEDLTAPDKEYEFTITLTDENGSGVEGTYQAAVASGNEDPAAIEDGVTFASGKAVYRLKANQKLYIYGLESGTSYEITETGVDGFTASSGDITGERGKGITVQGTVTSDSYTVDEENNVVHVEVTENDFINTYTVDPITFSGEENLKVQKVLNDRAWRQDDSFTFVLEGLDGAPMPDDAVSGISTINVTNGDETHFGDIEYSIPGTYEYEIYERTPSREDRLPGIEYSDALYKVTVTVEDNQDGTLSVSSVMEKEYEDNGDPAAGEFSGNVAQITNTFAEQTQSAAIYATKNYVDHSGANNRTFDFKLTAVGDAPMPGNAVTDETGTYITISNAAGGSIAFPRISYNSAEHDGQTYTYQMSEIIPEGATADNDYTVDGMQYDPTVYTVTVQPGVNAEGILDIAVTYTNADGTPIEGDRPVFTNTYTPEPLVLPDNAGTTIRGTKTLTGRDMAENEEFSFTISGSDRFTAGEMGTGVTFDRTTATVSGGTNGEAEEFGFGTITFYKPGTYTFNIVENAPENNSNGMSYDRHTAVVTVSVIDNSGKLELDGITYNNGTANSDTTVASFNNVYTASGVYNNGAGLQVTKTLNGRSMRAGEFNFTLTGQDEASQAKLSESETTFSHGSANSGVPRQMTILSGLSFNQDDAGKTFYFVVDEIEPTDGNGDVVNPKSGVTYDVSTYQISITVTDNGDGTLNIDDTITKDGAPAENIAFVNSYSAGTTTLGTAKTLSVVKTLDGRDWAEDETFTFTLADDSGNAIDSLSLIKPESGNVQTGSFNDITYDKAGTYVYKVTEDIPADTEKATGMTYSGEEYTVTVVVAEDQTAGTLSVDSVTVTNKRGASIDGELAFVNSYEEQNDNTKDVAVTQQDGTEINDAAGQLVGVGDVLKYTISWKNDAIGTNGLATEATVIVTDKIPAGTTLMPDSISDGGRLEDGSIIWDLGEQSANATGEVSFSVTVNDVEDGSNDKISNQANVKIGDNDPKTTTEVVNYVPTKEETTSPAEIKVGDILEYKITFHNVDGETGTVVDTLAKGLEYVDGSAAVSGAVSAEDDPVVDGQTLTWNLAELEANTEISITFKAEITREALTTVDNQATIHIGDNSYDTNTDTTPVPTDNAKHVYKDGVQVDGQLVGVGDELTYEIEWANGDEDGTVTIIDTLPKGLTVDPSSISDNGEYNEGVITWTLQDQAAGQRGTVSFKATVNDDIIEIEDGILTNTATVNNVEVSVTNDVPEKVSVDTATLDFTKELVGRDWNASDEFTFILTGNEGAPMPMDADGNVIEATVTKPENGNTATFGFGEITFIKAGTYSYTVTEDKTSDSIAGVKYDEHTAILTIVVADDGTGTLTATPEVTGGSFTNYYEAELDYSEATGGLSITKILNGRAMTEGQFKFQVTPAGEESAEKLGLKNGVNEFTTGAAEDGVSTSVNILANAADGVKFTQEDAGKTFSYTVKEVVDNAAGYTYDDVARTVTIAIADNENGTLTATTTVTKGAEEPTVYTYTTGQTEPAIAAEISFVNGYYASTDVEGGTAASVAVTKTMTGRPLVDGEFHFQITAKDKNGQDVVIVDDVANDVNGNVNFGTLSYDTESLKAAVDAGYAVRNTDGNWTVSYTASEKTDGLSAAGVTAEKASFDFTVSVVDNGDGTMTATANLPEGAGFANSYSTDTASVNINGSKALSVADGLNAPDIAGKFNFTITGEEGAPMPANTTVTNDAQGNIDFGPITFTIDVFNTEVSDDGVEAAGLERAGVRTRTFTYTVTESGTVEGVANDAAAKTFAITVTDDGTGHLTAVREPGTGALFTFTNTYSVTSTTSSITDQIAITKKLEGRDLIAEEFSFALAEGNTVVATGTNDADGKVTFSGIEYTEPGEHTYTVYEVKGEDGKGITYDSTQYTIHTSVTDNRNGTLNVTHTTDAGDAIVFVNEYKAASTSVKIGASKILNGRDIKKDEFTFQIKDGDGKVVAEAKNDEYGQIVFEALEFEKDGTYEYTVTEVNDKQNHITYDKTEYQLTVTVTDDGSGYLKAEVAGDTPVFTNTYTKPEDPKKPNDDGKNTGVRTGDQSRIILYGILIAISVIAVVIAGYVLIRRRRNYN